MKRLVIFILWISIKCIVPSTSFYTFAYKFIGMETIVIQVKGKSKAKQVLDAVKLFNGVTNATIATAEELENNAILKACLAARKTPKATKTDVLNALKWKLSIEVHLLRDIKKLKSAYTSNLIQTVIENCEMANTIADIKHCEPLHSKGKFFKIKYGQYRFGVFINAGTIEFLKFGTRQNFYDDFPPF